MRQSLEYLIKLGSNNLFYVCLLADLQSAAAANSLLLPNVFIVNRGVSSLQCINTGGIFCVKCVVGTVVGDSTLTAVVVANKPTALCVVCFQWRW